MSASFCPPAAVRGSDSSFRPRLGRASVALVVLTALAAFAIRAAAQPATASVAQANLSSIVQPATARFAVVPFGVGEELTYRASIGRIHAGTARMRVDGIEDVRGRPAYHVLFSIDGGIPFFRVHDRYESWIDVETLSSLRHTQHISEGRYKRSTVYEIFPERALYQKNDEPIEASVSDPLDDGSFVYALRSIGIAVGETRRYDRYFRPDRNPVILTGLRREQVDVGAGSFATVVVRPSIRANGVFSEDGDAQIWFSDDAKRLPVQIKTHFSKISLTLSLDSFVPGRTPGLAPAAPGAPEPLDRF